MVAGPNKNTCMHSTRVNHSCLYVQCIHGNVCILKIQTYIILDMYIVTCSIMHDMVIRV